LSVESFCSVIMLIFRYSKGTECAGIYKNLQSTTSPYRYLS
jgi:hypothetical protein